MSRSKLFSVDKEREICQLYLEGESTLTLAKYFSCHFTTIARLLKRHDVTRNLSEAGKLAFERGRFPKTKEWLKTTFNKGYVPWNKGKPRSEEMKRKISGTRHYAWVKRITRRCRWCGKNYLTISRRRQRFCSDSCRRKFFGREAHTNPKIIKKRFKALARRPTKPERKMMDLIKKHNLPFIYTGDGKVIIESLCPDFMDNDGSKRIIEVFGRVFHDTHIRRIPYIQTEKGRKEIFSKLGFRTLILWEEELEDENLVLQKIRGF